MDVILVQNNNKEDDEEKVELSKFEEKENEKRDED